MLESPLVQAIVVVTLFRSISFNYVFFMHHYDYYVELYIMLYSSSLLGPLTYTSDGKTTIYGVVSMPGVSGREGFCISPSTYFRVNKPDALPWIKTFLKN